MGKELRSDKILLDFGGDIGKKTVDQLISSHNILFDQRDELLEVVKEIILWGNTKDNKFFFSTSIERSREIEDLITKIERK